jgi:hypothetical protein
LKVLTGHKDKITAISVLKGFVWTGDELGDIIQWSCENFEQTNLIKGAHQGTIYHIFAFKKQDRNLQVWSSGKDRIVRIWDSEVWFLLIDHPFLTFMSWRHHK